MGCCAEHFRHEHWLCEDGGCLAKKFIVFLTEQELRQHCAREHGGAMTRAEKRQALTIPVNFQVAHALPSVAHLQHASSHILSCLWLPIPQLLGCWIYNSPIIKAVICHPEPNAQSLQGLQAWPEGFLLLG